MIRNISILVLFLLLCENILCFPNQSAATQTVSVRRIKNRTKEIDSEMLRHKLSFDVYLTFKVTDIGAGRNPGCFCVTTSTTFTGAANWT